MPSLLKFRTGTVAAIDSVRRAADARAECLRQHHIRCALADIGWYAANASVETQQLTKVRTVERIARLMIVRSRKQIRIEAAQDSRVLPYERHVANR